MKAKLIKTPEKLYKLKFYNNEDMVSCATGLLSKQNCDEIFGVVDVEKMANEYLRLFPKRLNDPNRNFVRMGMEEGFKEGFNKAMELNKDKVFTLKDMREAYDAGASNIDCDGDPIDNPDNDFLDTIQSLQPTEIDVEIVMKPYTEVSEGFSLQKKEEPKLDSSGQLILKKI